MSEELDKMARSICDSESFMWLMNGSNHPEMHINRLRDFYNSVYRPAGGGYNGLDSRR